MRLIVSHFVVIISMMLFTNYLQAQPLKVLPGRLYTVLILAKEPTILPSRLLLPVREARWNFALIELAARLSATLIFTIPDVHIYTLTVQLISWIMNATLSKPLAEPMMCV